MLAGQHNTTGSRGAQDWKIRAPSIPYII